MHLYCMCKIQEDCLQHTEDPSLLLPAQVQYTYMNLVESLGSAISILSLLPALEW